MILIFIAKIDSHVGAVSKHLDAAGVAWVRIDTEDVATNVELTVNPTGGNGTLFVRDSGEHIDLRRVTAVWYRKPEPVAVEHLAVEAGLLEYVEAEFTEILMGIYRCLRMPFGSTIHLQRNTHTANFCSFVWLGFKEDSNEPVRAVAIRPEEPPERARPLRKKNVPLSGHARDCETARDREFVFTN